MEERHLTEYQKAVEEAAGMPIDWQMVNASVAARQSQPAPTEKCPKCRQALFSYCANGDCANFCQNVLIAQTGEAQPADKESVPAKWYRNGVLDANEIVLRFEFAYMAITGEFFLYEMFHALESQ